MLKTIKINTNKLVFQNKYFSRNNVAVKDCSKSEKVQLIQKNDLNLHIPKTNFNNRI